MGDLVKLYPKDAAKDPDNVLEQAIGQYEEVFIIGKGKDGTIDPRSSLGLSVEEVLMILETFKFKLLRGDYDAAFEEGQ